MIYNGAQVSVADFLEQGRKWKWAQKKLDARHLSKGEFETVLSGLGCVRRPVEDAVLRNLRLENLRRAIDKLDARDQEMTSLCYSGELTTEEIGQICGIPKMAASKRLKKLHEKTGELCLMTGLLNFFIFLVYKCALSVLRPSPRRDLCASMRRFKLQYR